MAFSYNLNIFTVKNNTLVIIEIFLMMNLYIF